MKKKKRGNKIPGWRLVSIDTILDFRRGNCFYVDFAREHDICSRHINQSDHEKFLCSIIIYPLKLGYPAFLFSLGTWRFFFVLVYILRIMLVTNIFLQFSLLPWCQCSQHSMITTGILCFTQFGELF